MVTAILRKVTFWNYRILRVILCVCRWKMTSEMLIILG